MTRFPNADLPTSHRYATAVPLSAGATSEVYKAYDPVLERHVALKFLRRDDPHLLDRMLREARAQARLKHENICQVYEVGELDGRPYIAMQLVDGSELGVAARTMDMRQKVEVMRCVAEALHSAHEAGLVHRDLKPANIMVQRFDDGRLKPMVVDFGLVWAEESEAMTHAGQVLGTPPYLAPEQVEGRREAMDRRTDVYGLGATLYDLIAGRPPFADESSVELLVKTVHEEPPSPRTFNPAIPIDLETIVLKCLEKDPARRYDSARALADDLQRFLDGEPIEARPVSVIYRLRKTLIKHRALVIVCTLALVVMLSLIATLHWRASKRLFYEQDYGQMGKDFDWTIRAEYMSSLHDIREAKNSVRQRVRQIEAQLDTLGSLGRGPAHYAIGRGYLALLEDEPALEHLQQAWEWDYRTPDVAFSLGLVLGRRYSEGLDRARRVADPELRAASVARHIAQYRQPVLDYLRQGREAEAAAPEYVEALLAMYEGEYDQALTKVKQALADLPWLYEGDILEGDIHMRRGNAARARGAIEDAWAAYRYADAAYRKATLSAASDPRAHLGLCEVGGAVMEMSILLDQAEAVASHRDAAIESCRNAQTIDPELVTPVIHEATLLLRWARFQFKRAAPEVLVALADAEQRARAAVEQASDDPFAQWTLGDVYRLRGEHVARARDGEDPTPFYRQAIARYEDALQQEANHPLVLKRMGDVYQQQALYEIFRGLDSRTALAQSVRYLEQVVALTPDVASAHQSLNKALVTQAFHAQRRGEDFAPDARKAVEHGRRALELSPDDPALLADLAAALGLSAEYLFYREEAYEPLIVEAHRYIVQALELQPSVSLFWGYLFDLLLLQGRCEVLSGEDPADALDMASVHIEAFGTHFGLPLAQASARRWLDFELVRLLGRAAGHDLAVDLDRVDAVYATMALTPNADLSNINIALRYHATRALLARRGLGAGRAAADASVRDGLALANQALESRADTTWVRLYRGTLHALAARMATDRAAARTLQATAESDWLEAQRANRWVTREIEMWQQLIDDRSTVTRVGR